MRQYRTAGVRFSGTIDEMPDRIKAKVSIKTNGCWMWTGPKSKGEYCQLWYDKRQRAVHRFFYEWLIADIPDGLTIDHLCNTPRCVNPHHLLPATIWDNVRRGNSPTSINSRKKECHRGHSLTGANLHISSQGRRICMTCSRDTKRINYAKVRGGSVLPQPHLRTHCAKGHEYTEDNTQIVVGKTGLWRHCRTCKAIGARRRNKVLRERAKAFDTPEMAAAKREERKVYYRDYRMRKKTGDVRTATLRPKY